MKPYVYKKRLEALADFLVTVSPKKFDFSQFASATNLGEPNCGTVGCALGWACTMPKFQNLGLRLAQTDERTIEPILPDADLEGWTVAMYLFDLTTEDAQYLFIPMYRHPELGFGEARSATPKQVAEHIREFIKVRYK